ncbi:MAG: T9SS type A sorting domain-containing protein [candidate division WOR-3 bacterium]
MFTLLLILSINSDYYYRGFSEKDEIKELRTENSKLFKNKKGKLVLRIFSRTIHYFDENGNFVDIPFNNLTKDTLIYPQFKNQLLAPTDSSDGSLCGENDGFFCLFDNCSGSCDIGCGYYIWINEAYLINGFVLFNTSSIPDSANIDTIKLSMNCVNPGTPFSCTAKHDIVEIRTTQTFSNGCDLYIDAIDGDQYISDYCPYTTGIKTWLLSDESTDSAALQMKRLLPYDWFAVGLSGWSSAFASYSIGYQKGSANIDVPLGNMEIYFIALPFPTKVILKWYSESSEIVYFELRKNQEFLTRIQREGNIYNYIDENVKENEVYTYTLIGHYNKGDSRILNKIKVKIPPLPPYDIKILNSLSDSRLFLKLSIPERKTVKIEIINVLGQKLSEKSHNLTPGNYIIPVLLPDIRGVYFLKISHEREEKILKTIKILR